jgi:hypothetical protein
MRRNAAFILSLVLLLTIGLLGNGVVFAQQSSVDQNKILAQSDPPIQCWFNQATCISNCTGNPCPTCWPEWISIGGQNYTMWCCYYGASCNK